jgi:hypothetical protein
MAARGGHACSCDGWQNTNRAIESAGRRAADPARGYRKLGERHADRCVLFQGQTMGRVAPFLGPTHLLRGQAHIGVALAREG